jgi:hypothetical protein
MEEFLHWQRWADTRAEREGGDWDSTHEVEQGLVAFQTLLEYHTDIAFDFFGFVGRPKDLPLWEAASFDLIWFFALKITIRNSSTG